jgi:hypothetical protein
VRFLLRAFPPCAWRFRTGVSERLAPPNWPNEYADPFKLGTLPPSHDSSSVAPNGGNGPLRVVLEGRETS